MAAGRASDQSMTGIEITATLLVKLDYNIDAAHHLDAWAGHDLKYSLIAEAMGGLVAQGCRPLA
ncbi:hypothetical protein [Allosphingosinicella sp.]|uniref:hypothetical protein n=1 Tax=Allosphingosinicella sp. TaxID=2823234 RepID=UPI003D727FA7